MLTQPSPNFNNDANHIHWQALLNLADILSTKYSIKSLLSYIIQVLEPESNWKIRLWLDPSFSNLVANEGLETTDALIQDPSPLMEQVYLNKEIYSNIGDNPGDNDNRYTVVIPLMARAQVLGVIQVETESLDNVTTQDIELVITLISQFAIALSYLLNTPQHQYTQNRINHLHICEEISKSILSNLDRDSLLNNLLSLMHQKFNCSRVNIYMLRGDNKNVLKKIGISMEGIDPEKVYHFDQGSRLVSNCITRLEPVLVNDINLSLSYSSADIDKNIQSELIIPLINGELLLGAIELWSDSKDEFGPDSLEGFHVLAQYISTAIRNADTYYLEQSRRKLSDRLESMIGPISSEVSLDDLLHIILDELENLLDWDAAAIWLFDRATTETGLDQFTSFLRLAAFRINEKSFAQSGQNLPQKVGELLDKYFDRTIGEDDLLSVYPWISEIIDSRSPIIRNSPFQYEPIGAILGLNNDYSAIAAPLINQDQIIGFVVIAHQLSDQYSSESQLLTTAFMSRVSTAINNSKLYAAAHDQAWISTVLLQVADATQSITNLDELLETVVSMLPGLIGVDSCMIFLLDQSTGYFIPRAFHGFDELSKDEFNTWEIFPGEYTAFDELKATTKPIIIDKGNLPKDFATHIFPHYDFESNMMILFPLTSQTSLCGAILFDFSNSNLAKDSSQEIWDEQYTLIEGAARQTAIAIENLQLIKSQEEEAYTSIALLQVAQAIVSFNQLNEILSSIVRITPILVGVKRCIIYLWDSKEIVFRQSEYFGFSKNDLAVLGKEIKASEFPFIEAIQQGNQILYHLLGKEVTPINWSEITLGDYQVVESVVSDVNDDISIKLDGKSLGEREPLLIGFPLSVKNEVLGVMLVEEEEPIRGIPSVHIRERRIEIVKGISQQAAIAIKNELLQDEAVKSEGMERELQLAREIQTTFLPDRLPSLPGWDIGVRWRPARQVGGDFYDLLLLPNDQVGFVIADVADKGMPAALFMTLIRTLIRAAARDQSSPAAVLKQVNELLIPDSKHGMFVTVFYGIISLKSGKLVYANAGHNPPLVKQLDHDGLIELTRTTIALGLFEDIEVDERDLVINPGDWILLYTDGVTEAFSSGEELFGTKRLFDILENYTFISSNDLVDKIQGSVDDFIKGVDLSDDVTLAAIFRKPFE